MNNRRILVIDDMPTMTRIIDLFLSQRGFRVRTVNDSRQGEQVAREFQPEVVLLDISMPHMNGYEVARRIRAAPGLQSLPIIAVTSLDDAEHFTEAQSAGIDYQMTKPCDLGRLSELLESCGRAPQS
jgi:DNA-binding response OmpR family regulator